MNLTRPPRRRVTWTRTAAPIALTVIALAATGVIVGLIVGQAVHYANTELHLDPLDLAVVATAATLTLYTLRNRL